MRVVVADDNADVRLMLRLAMELDGRFKVVAESATGCEALHACEDHRPDAVILDDDMPVLTGRDALPHIVHRAPETKIIVFSGQLFDDADALYEAGAAAVVAKVTPPADLLEAVAAAVASRFN